MSATEVTAAARGGFFVTLEGPDGGGKSTQLEPLAQALRAQGHAVTVSREPGGTPLGEQVRRLLLESADGAIAPWTEALLFTAARAELVARVIRPALASGAIVLCDRYLDSTLAYQGAGRGLDRQLLGLLQEQATAGLRPDLTLWFDVPVETAIARRRQGQQDRLDRETAAFHARVREGYRQLAAADPNRWVLIDASRDAASLRAEVVAVVCERVRLVGLGPRAPQA
jgi:dTMP kinase